MTRLTGVRPAVDFSWIALLYSVILGHYGWVESAQCLCSQMQTIYQVLGYLMHFEICFDKIILFKYFSDLYVW